jgi:GNAT superfamily N-acetyltransferase
MCGKLRLMPFRESFAPKRFWLRHLHHKRVEAELRPASFADAATWARDWQPVLRRYARPDADWPWRAHITRAASHEGYLSLAVARDGALDALMSLTEKQEKSRLDPEHTVVYVEFVGIAPQHQAPPVGERVITGLGRVMLEAAAEIATKIGHNGRIGLHAKPDVEDFYRSLRLHECAEEECSDGTWRYFETCASWLRGERLRKGVLAT